MKKILVTLVLSVLLLVSCGVTPMGTDSPQSSDASAQTNIPSGLIGVDKAKEIALGRAGLNMDDAKFDRTELDNDNGIWVYEIEFKTPTTEYDVEIKADDGTIIKWETDGND